MTLYDKRKKKISHDLKDKEYRDAFVEAGISVGIPFQIKALREQRKWTQKDLEKMSGMKQTRISLMEDPNYSASFSLKTLLKLASAFDIGLIVRFASFGELAERELKLSTETLEALNFKDDPYFKQEDFKKNLDENAAAEVSVVVHKTAADVVSLADYRREKHRASTARNIRIPLASASSDSYQTMLQ